MSRITTLVRGIVGLGALGALAACGDADSKVLVPTVSPGGDALHTYVAIGNSITAGYQSGGLNDSTQRQSYANLFALQAGTRFTYPAFPKPGCTPPTGNWFSGKAIDSLAPVPGGCTLRDASKATDILNNVGVPGAYAGSIVTRDESALTTGNPLQTLILGGRTQLELAIKADPTFVSFWLGNNETLAPASVGLLGGLSGSAAPLIPASVVVPQFKQALDSLVAAKPNLKGVIFASVKVTNAPRFFPADSFASATKLAAFQTYHGKGATTVIACGTAVTGWLASIELAKAIKAGSHPNVVSCVKNTPAAPVGDIFMLDPTEVATLNATTDAYNAYLKAKADTLGWAYVDVNPTLASLRAGTAPAIPAFPNFTSTTRDAAGSVFGALFSLDGAHPSAAGQKLIANLMIDSVNAKYSLAIPKVP